MIIFKILNNYNLILNKKVAYNNKLLYVSFYYKNLYDI